MVNYKLISEDVCIKTPRFAATAVCYEGDNGQTIKHTIIRSKPSVAVIVLNESNEIALIRQFRTTTGKYYWEIPAGLIEYGENLQDAAKREVSEEASLTLKDVRQVVMGSSLLDPSKSDEDFGVAVAQVTGTTSRHLDEQEAIDEDIVWMPIEEAYKRLWRQMKTGKAFYESFEMSGHSVYALLAYQFTE